MKPIEQDVLETVRSAVKVALASAATAGNLDAVAQVIVGWPTSTELDKILSQAQSQVSVYLLAGGKQDTRYAPEYVSVSAPNVPLTAEVVDDTLTFSGSVIPGLNIHTFFGSPLVDAYFQTVTGDNLQSVATKTQNAINELAVQGISASATGASVKITQDLSFATPDLVNLNSPMALDESGALNQAGSLDGGSSSGNITSPWYLSCNIGASVVPLVREAQLLQNSVQVSVWCPDPNTRFAMIDPLLSSIGTIDNSFLTLSNGMSMRIQFSGRQNWNNDKLQLSYSCYEAHLVYDVEYYAVSSISGSQVESIEEHFSINNAAAHIFIND
jgi:hypothetical protein